MVAVGAAARLAAALPEGSIGGEQVRQACVQLKLMITFYIKTLQRCS